MTAGPSPNRLLGGWRNAVHPHRVLQDTDDQPLISVITVVRNGAATLEACIRSVQAQSYPNVEHIIIDGGSTDGTLDILRRHDGELAYWSSGKDAGIYDALNKGVEAVNGRYYVPLGCDDLMTPDGAAAFARHVGQADIAYGHVRFNCPDHPPRLIRNHSAGVAIKVDAHRRWGLYDISYRIAADTKFLNMVRRFGTVVHFDDVVGVFVAGGASGNYARNIREHARAMRESGTWGPLRSFVWLAPRLIRVSLTQG